MATHDERILQLFTVHEGEGDPVPLLMTQVEPVVVVVVERVVEEGGGGGCEEVEGATSPAPTGGGPWK